MGGQAVLEGVMMRGASTWAVAVRDPDGSIQVDVREVPGWSERYRNIPVLRGVTGLGESLGLGYRALTWSANQQVPEDQRVSEKVMGWAVGGRGGRVQRAVHRPARARGSLARSPLPRLVPDRRRRRPARDLRRVPARDRAHARHPARVPVPRRRAQGDRRVRERRRADARRPRSSSRPRTCAAAPTSC